jgi:DNA polymerase-3 subunit epsilon
MESKYVRYILPLLGLFMVGSIAYSFIPQSQKTEYHASMPHNMNLVFDYIEKKLNKKVDKIVFFDTETTGLKPGSIVEIGCISVLKHEKGYSIHKYHTYLKPSCKIEPGAFRVHGLSEEFLSTKHSFKKIAKPLRNFIKNGVLIAHNALFDIKFMNKEFSRCGMGHLHNPVIDSIDLAHEVFGHDFKVNLDNLIKEFGIEARGTHSAMQDAEILMEIFGKLVQLLPN